MRPERGTFWGTGWCHAWLLAGAFSFFACASAPVNTDGNDSELTSKDADILDFEFRGEVLAAPNDDTRKSITSQLFYLVGALTKNLTANGQVGRVELSNIVEHKEGGKKRIAYAARLPVAISRSVYGFKDSHEWELVLPRDMTTIDAFNKKYDGKCGVREESVGLESFWYNFDPSAKSCHLKEADVIRVSAKVKPNRRITHGKYPEYDALWKDGVLEVVSVFNTADGNGRREQYQSFVDAVRSLLATSTLTENKHGPSLLRDESVEGTVPVGGTNKKVRITALEVDKLYDGAGPDFDKRFGALSEKADFVTYVGHSMLGKNTRALSQKSRVAAGKYQIFFFNSCDSFAYADNTLTARNAAVNGAADPLGTKYLDVMTNVLPSYVRSESSSILAVLGALIAPDRPKTYEEILAGLPSEQLVVVWGEEDNSFRP